MARNFGRFKDIGIPPESTGPRIHNLVFQSIELVSVGGTLVQELSIVGLTSGAVGVIKEVQGSSVTVVVASNSPTQSFAGSEIVEIDGGAFTATTTTVTNLYVNATTVVDADDPYRVQRIGDRGGAYIRFADGDQQLSAFGVTKTTGVTALDAFKNQYSEALREVSDDITGSATITHLPDQSSYDMATTTGGTDSVIRTTDKYYPYIPGVGRYAIFSLTVGDSGKANNVRRWGMYDDENGVYFELDGTTFNVVQRSNTTGSVVDTKVAQANWNGDILDGTGSLQNRSALNLDITASNVYWIDYAWLGSGRVRFGVLGQNGQRITAHSFENGNQSAGPYMTTGSLPMRWENTNTGVTSGASSLVPICAVILNDGDQQKPEHAYLLSYDRINVSAANGSETLLFNLRSATTFNSITNRIISRGVEASVVSELHPVIVRVYENATIGGVPSWSAINAGSPLEVDTAGTVSGGTQVAVTMVGAGHAENIDLDFLELHTNASGLTSKTYSVVAQSLGAAASDTSIGFTWLDQG